MFLSFSSYAETYSIETQANGIDKTDVETILELLKMNFKSEFGAKNELTTSDKATFKLKAKILKLDNLYIVNLEKEKANSFVFASTIKAPKSAELDQKIARLIRSVVNEKPLIEKVGEITESEKDEVSNRRKSVNRWYVGFGPAWGKKLLSETTMTDFSIGYSWEVNTQSSIRTIWDLVSEPGSSKNAKMSNLGLGLQYFLNNDNSAPYVQGDFGWAATTTNFKEEKSSFSIGAVAGYTLFRTSSTNFDISLRFQTLTSSNSAGTPATTSIRIGVLF
jgi:hypothetical protein